MTVDSHDRPQGYTHLPGGGQIAYQIHGREHDGIPLLLIRPLGGSMALWGAFRTRLATRHRVISFDLPGTGHSTDRGWVTTRRLARDSVHVLADLGIARAHVFGISLGGMTATWLAIFAPTRVARLCIASAPLRGIELARRGFVRELAMAACFAERRAKVEASLVDWVLSRRFHQDHPDEVRRIEDILRADPATRTALFKHAVAGFLHDAHRRARRIQAPTLVLAGEEDILLGTESPRALSRAIPGAAFEIIAACGHDLTLERPIVTADRVSEFLLS